jgi:UDP-N-acetylmuramoyl-L-alanyl-D-glutamate--2,6-diaminopimelate ligase
MAATASIDGVELRYLLPDRPLSELVGDIKVSGIQLDSRRIRPGDLFLALPGVDQIDSNDGRNYILEAVAAGAVAVIAQGGWQDSNSVIERCQVPVLLVTNLVDQVSTIAGRFYGQPSKYLNVIGITGTNGKSTCAFLLTQLLNKAAVRTGVMGTLGYGVPGSEGADTASLTSSELTTLDAVENQKILAKLSTEGAKCVVMEVSSHGLDQGRVSGINMTGAVFTNLSRDHLDYHHTMADYMAAKQKLFMVEGLKFAVINADDECADSLLESVANSAHCLTYSTKVKTASIYAGDISLSTDGIAAKIITPWGEGRLRSRLIGEFNLSNLLAVIAVAGAMGVGFSEIINLIPELHAVAGRLEVVSGAAGPLAIVDYAHTPDALALTLGALHSATGIKGGNLWCVFGCGGERDKGKRPRMAAVAERLADIVVVTSDNPRTESEKNIIDDILAGASRPFHKIEDRAEAIRFAIVRAQPNDTVLIAGKGHETYQIKGKTRLPFDDAAQVRLALHSRAANDKDGDKNCMS